jgi:hypothetical protein
MLSFTRSVGLAAGAWRWCSHPDDGARRRFLWADPIARVVDGRKRFRPLGGDIQ